LDKGGGEADRSSKGSAVNSEAILPLYPLLSTPLKKWTIKVDESIVTSVLNNAHVDNPVIKMVNSRMTLH
jgi:hypothetical protein